MGSELLGGNLACGEEAAARASGATHGMFVTRFVKIGLERSQMGLVRRKMRMYLALAGEAVDLFEAGAGYSALEDAKVLLCVDIEGLVVDVCELEGWLGLRGDRLGRGGRGGRIRGLALKDVVVVVELEVVWLSVKGAEELVVLCDVEVVVELGVLVVVDVVEGVVDDVRLRVQAVLDSVLLLLLDVVEVHRWPLIGSCEHQA